MNHDNVLPTISICFFQENMSVRKMAINMPVMVKLNNILTKCSNCIQLCKNIVDENKIEIITYTTHILVSHPFIVLRRQCQVRADSQEYHILPISLVPVAVTLIQKNGVKVLFKGLFSAIVLCLVQVGVERIMSKLTGWPTKLPPTWYVNKEWLHHFLLKSSTLIITAPIYSASVINTIAVSRNPIDYDCPMFNKYDFPLSFFQTILPTAGYGVVKYAFTQAALSLSVAVLYLSHCFNEATRVSCQTEGGLGYEDRQDIYLKATVISYMSAEIVFYPLETVVHRLILQGQQIFTNNLDCGTSVVQIASTHDGFFDCCDNVTWLEGKMGLYKGFGALIMQVILYHYCIKLVSFTWHYIRMYRKTFSYPYILAPAIERQSNEENRNQNTSHNEGGDQNTHQC